MDTTRQSLLVRARSGDEAAWADLYRPLLVGWLRYQGVPTDERDDLVQETLVAVLHGLPAFRELGLSPGPDLRAGWPDRRRP